MKTDDFEKQLQQQPLRPVREHWRNQILQAAKRSEGLASRVGSHAKKSWLYQLLWPCPQAWGALAAIWVVVLFLNYTGSEADVTVAKEPTESREVLMAVKQQLQLREELMSANDMPAVEPPKMSAPQSGLKPSIQIMAV